MHKQKITHRDLKPENLLCQYNDDGSFDIKLTDFGFATAFKADQKMSLSLGSPLYMSPELCAEKEYDHRVDVWAVGVIGYILLSGMPPFFGKSKDQIYHAIINSKVSFDNSVWDNISEEAIDFVKGCFIKDFSQRPEVDDLLNHKWLEEAFEKSNTVDPKTQL